LSARSSNNQSELSESIPFRIHPRAFKALGADLVTNDVVAIIELVKNSYDAYATEVDIRFREGDGFQILEIEDNGAGMSLETIKQAWCTVATDYRRDHPVARRQGKRNRRTTGAKGLGRLSAARLGSTLEMLTQVDDGQCWNIQVDWNRLADADSLEQCVATIKPAPASPFKRSGTLIRIAPLRSSWGEATYDDLRDNLARLLAPFDTKQDFKIKLGRPGLFVDSIDVEPPAFLLKPKYSICGDIDASGKMHYRYSFNSIKGDTNRYMSGIVSWSQVQEASPEPTLEQMNQPKFGPFSFEIRGWDIGPSDTQEIAERFELKKSTIRRDIRAYKGISVYRDDVLVLPKSEGNRDWLGLDLRRVGRVGHRLSTTQLVGYVAITATDNPLLEDTSDRERLASTPEVIGFEEMLRTIVSTMENEREKDRRNYAKEKRVVELFKELNARDLVAGVAEVAKDGGPASDALPLVEDFGDKLDKAREEIESRFIYYSRLATIGTISQMLMHEVRNRTSILGKMLETIKSRLVIPPEENTLVSRIELGEVSLAALDKLADTFAPLANRQFRRRMRGACIEESIARCVLMISGELKTNKIKVIIPSDSVTEVAVDPGELDAILLNLLSNAAYWLNHKEIGSRQIEIRTHRLTDGKRVQIEIHDSGPGVAQDDAERIFWPGVTNKPGGIGMGLTVASELVAEYGGRLALDLKGKLGGATFLFDVPLKS
jgi:signal transduction histidine kinase